MFKNKGNDLYIDNKKVLLAWESWNGLYWFATEKSHNQDSVINGKVYKNCNWNEWGLSCDSHELKDLEVYECYKKGDQIPKSHYLWTPMKIVFDNDN